MTWPDLSQIILDEFKQYMKFSRAYEKMEQQHVIRRINDYLRTYYGG